MLQIHLDASYLSKTRARSKAGGFSLEWQPKPTHQQCNSFSQQHHAFHPQICYGSRGRNPFHNAQDGAMLCTMLSKLCHPQPMTSIQTNNEVADGIINDCVKQWWSKAIDMCFYWVCDHVWQGQFRIHWKKGSENLAHYFTKHHPPMHHEWMCPIYLHTASETAAHSTPHEGVLMMHTVMSSDIT